MDWFLIFVFLYIAALTHFLADLLSHWWKEKGILLVLHSFCYALFFIPVFWFVKANPLWLILIFGSHLLIDSGGKYLSWLVKRILRESTVSVEMAKIITLGLDQVLHLLTLLIIALLAV